MTLRVWLRNYGGKTSLKAGYDKICLGTTDDADINTALEFKKLA